MIDYRELKPARKKKGLTQCQVAEALGVAVITYKFWEYGQINPRKKNEIALRKILDLKKGSTITSYKEFVEAQMERGEKFDRPEGENRNN